MNASLSGPRRLPLMIAVFATALSVLAFEVALSRAFSVLLRYHFVFLAISLATCGMGLGGMLDYLTEGWFRRTWTPTIHLISRSLLLAILYPISIALLFGTPLAALLTSVWVVSGICVLPFLVAGTLLSRIFAENSQAGGTLYFSDLLGAALGSFLVIGGLQLFGATNVPLICGLIAAGGALSLAVSSHLRGGVTASALVMVLLVLALVGNVRTHRLDLPVMPLAADATAKPLYKELGDPKSGAKLVYSEWNAFARTDVVSNARPDGTLDPQDDLYIYTDGEVPTNMLWYQGDLRPLSARLRSFIGYAPFAWFRPKDVLLIGPGGGLDVLLGAAVGARRIDGVEINPSIPRIVRRYGKFNGNVYDLANVNIRVDEGRSFVRRSSARYDLIYMALTKTATTASSSLALVEGYIYTREAIADYLAHLTLDGKVALVFQEPALVLRVYLTALEALQSRGMSRADALRCLMVLSVPEPMYMMGPYRHLLIISGKPFAPAVSELLAKRTIAAGMVPGYFPGAFEPVPFSWLTQKQATTPQFVDAWNQWQFGSRQLNISPRTDDQPFVVDLTFAVPLQFRLLLIGALVLAILLSALALRSESAASGLRGSLTGAVVYFSLLGIGFMFVEVALTQKLVLYLGYPVLTLSVILFSLLLGSGLGSLTSQRWPTTSAWKVASGASLAVVLYGLALQFSQQAIVTATLGSDLRLRCLITLLMLLPLGFALGMPFPTGLRAVGARTARFVPWMWGVNGLTSVVGSVGSMILAKVGGFSLTLMAGWLIYALVFVLSISGLAVGKRSKK